MRVGDERHETRRPATAATNGLFAYRLAADRHTVGAPSADPMTETDHKANALSRAVALVGGKKDPKKENNTFSVAKSHTDD